MYTRICIDDFPIRGYCNIILNDKVQVLVVKPGCLMAAFRLMMSPAINLLLILVALNAALGDY